MATRISPETLALESTVQNILTTRRITRNDQRLLMKLGMDAIQNQQTMSLMNQVSDALRLGLLRVVD